MKDHVNPVAGIVLSLSVSQMFYPKLQKRLSDVGHFQEHAVQNEAVAQRAHPEMSRLYPSDIVYI